ncbi:TetR/AcrR family transcriptional regulator [Aquiflexum sp.]|uniref:TetR/AcrR family transcriptional regulator n=1 Tax=Aquiflexum sp. TaxID=1872584 RepID=UPI0035940C10
MNSELEKRKYRMTSRAEKVSQNDQKIMKAIVQLWEELPINEITLEKVAIKSGVTVRTILRKFGSKEGLIEACVENDAAGRRKNRDLAVPGDYKRALEILLEDYEKLGDASIRTLAVEEELPIAGKMLDKGRANHREWCKKVFAPDLPDANSPEYEHRLMTFITATEFYLWKLLRRDLKRSYEETYKIYRSLLEGLIQRKIS